MYGQFIRDMPEGTEKEKSWLWLKKCDLKIPSEALICSAQEQATRTNYVKYHIDKSVDSPSCRMCGETGETLSRIVSECSKLAQRENKRRHDNVARMVHWKLCQEFSLEKSEKWYLHNPQTVSENVNHKLIWDMNIQCDNIIVERRPDIFIVNKMEKTAIDIDIIDIAVPRDKRIIDKEKQNIEKYQNLKREIQRLWNLKKIDVIPVVLGALGSVTKIFEKYVDKIGIKIDLYIVQKTTLLGTARILRKMLEC